MADEAQIAKELVDFAETLVWRLIRRYGLSWGSHRMEDAQYELFAAGWQVWRETGNVGFARNRMSSRSVNLLRDYSIEERHEPKGESSFPPPEDGQSSIFAMKRARTSDPVEEAIWNEAIKRLTERQQQIVLYRYAGLSHKEIAAEMGLSVRTVEREWSTIKKELEYVRVS